MVPWLIVTLVVAGVLALLWLYFWVTTANKLVELDEQINLTTRSLAGAYQQRHDLIPDAVRAVNQSIKTQHDYLDKILTVRKTMFPNWKPEDLSQPDNELMAAIMGAMVGRSVTLDNNVPIDVAVYAVYMQVKSETDKDVSGAARQHAAAIAQFNAAIRAFPASIVASSKGFEVIETPKIPEELKQNPASTFS